MKFSTPALIAATAMFPVAASGYSLFGPSLFEPALTFTPMVRRPRSLFRTFDDAFQQTSPRYEITNTPETLQIAMDVPGVKMEDVNVSLEDGGQYLTIRGSRQAKSESSSYSSEFSQSFSLDPVVDVTKIQANLMDGVLTITAPKDVKRLEQTVQSIPILASAPPELKQPKLEASETKKEEKKPEENKDVHDVETEEDATIEL